MENLYTLLGISSNSTPDEIKKAYKVLALKYHPDKNNNPDSKEHFIKIHTAYKILMNCKHSNTDLSSLIKNYINNISPNLGDIYSNIIKTVYNNENEYNIDINNLNVTNLYDKIKNTFNNMNVTDIHDNIFPSLSKSQLNINATIDVSIEDVYLEKYANIKIKRTTKHDYEGLIQLTASQIIIDDEGEFSNNIHGDLIITINIDTSTSKYKLVDNNILMDHDITLYQYLYGDKIKIKFIHEDIKIEFKSFIENIPIIKVDNKGINIDNIQGDLYIRLKIVNIFDINNINVIKSIV